MEEECKRLHSKPKKGYSQAYKAWSGRKKKGEPSNRVREQYSVYSVSSMVRAICK